ncbi:heterokaryon incompatibility protein-domain-containing protein [Podospora aff. communis PSN243]|uniref:Heterokaryon incompatibility protein-domain-containing protein n=1 Tax=Podospora aff. communis PSN243 TaxID=3040156 RepID=A0AAV9H864_9PEZI|nr:heterokaryon incompatibility protein-domain-containing protein [Podospora aff. communis PSN243]
MDAEYACLPENRCEVCFFCMKTGVDIGFSTLDRYSDLVKWSGCPSRDLILSLIRNPHHGADHTTRIDSPDRCYHLAFASLSVTPDWLGGGKSVIAILDNSVPQTVYGRIWRDWNGSFPFGVSETRLKPLALRQWILECEAGHEQSNFPRRRIIPHLDNLDSPIDITLIDVVDECLVRASTSSRYLALSYVWGGRHGLTLNVSNRRALEEPGSLFIQDSDVPQLIKDAILLVREVSERYLWVDCLCIEQDNTLQKHFNVARMDVVYSQGLATICVLSARDAVSSIPGFGNEARAPTFRSQHLPLVSWPLPLEAELSRSIYETRAWTLQERASSKRCIFLTKHAAHFYCSKHCQLASDWNEQEYGELGRLGAYGTNRLLHVLDPLSAMHEHGKELFGSYATMVHQYTARKLGFESDVLNAFSGILSTFVKKSWGSQVTRGSVGGLLEHLIHSSLLWHHADWRTPSKPLEFKRRPNFPSWSWAGWEGDVSYFQGPIYLSDFATMGYAMEGRRPDTSRLRIELQDLQTSSETPKRPVMDGVRVAFLRHPLQPQYTKDILHFRAETCHAGTKASQDGADSSTISHMGSLESRNIGLVLLSSSPCTLDIRNESGMTTHSADMLKCNYMDAEFCACSEASCWFGHVMIIGWISETRAERLGLATVQMAAWKQTVRIERSITLV